MLAIAVEKARLRVIAAGDRLADAQMAERDLNTKEFQVHWSQFLTSLNSVYASIERGANASEASRRWYDEVKKIRREDALLQYLHHARNSDEHTLAPVFAPLHGVEIPAPASTPSWQSHDYSVEWTVGEEFEPTNLKIVSKDGRPTGVQKRIVSFRLLAVVDRGRRYEPPQVHLGNLISDPRPIVVGTLGLDHAQRLTTKAALLVSG